MSGAAIELSDVRVELGGSTVLGPLELRVDAGEHVLVVGPSGCGKTTLLRLLAGFVPPATGALTLFGERVAAAGRVLVPPERRRVAMLFQGGALWPHMSVRRTLAFTLKRAGERPTSARIAELCAAVRLEGKDERRPAELSGGEKQRLALARALAARPRLLLLDEPLGPLDAELRGALLETLAGLQRAHGWSVLHVTHDPTEARAIADRAIRLESGRLVQTGADLRPSAQP